MSIEKPVSRPVTIRLPMSDFNKVVEIARIQDRPISNVIKRIVSQHIHESRPG